MTEEEKEHLNSVVFTKKIVRRKPQFDEYTIQLLQTFMEETKQKFHNSFIKQRKSKTFLLFMRLA